VILIKWRGRRRSERRRQDTGGDTTLEKNSDSLLEPFVEDEKTHIPAFLQGDDNGFASLDKWDVPASEGKVGTEQLRLPAIEYVRVLVDLSINRRVADKAGLTAVQLT
jgi:hypothetical protein